MSILPALREALLGLFRKESADREMDEEMRFHLEAQVAENVRHGMGPAEARRAALRAFGGVERWREATRDARGARPVDEAARDVAFAVRLLRRSPGFTAVAVLTLGLGIGATTAIFSVVDGVLLDPLPYRNADRLVSVWGRFLPESGFDFPTFPLSPPEYFDYREQARALDDVAAYTSTSRTLTGPEGEPTRVRAAFVTGHLMGLLGVRPLLGRTVQPGDDEPASAGSVVVLSHALWQTRFGGDAAILGRTLTLDGVAHEVVGVMPPGFTFPGERTELWGALGLDPSSGGRSQHYLSAIGRLAEGVTEETAHAEMATLMAAWRAEYPDVHTGHFLYLNALVDDLVGSARPALLVLLGAVGFVLLIVCANMASLMLARSEARQRELAVRSALGAGGRRLVQQLLTEGVILGVLGGALGVAVAYGGVRAILLLGGSSIPRAAEVGVDGRVLAFAAAVSLLAALLFGLAPAAQAAGTDPRAAMGEGARGGTGGRRTARLRQALVIAEVAVAVLLVTAAGLAVRSFGALLDVDGGFRPEGALVVQLNLPASDYPDTRAAAGFYARLQERLAALPGVSSASASGALPYIATPSNVDFEIEGRARAAPGQPALSGDAITALPGWPEALGMEVLEGRFFRPSDDADAPLVAVVNRTAAELFWPTASPLGARIRMASDADGPWHTIVGVVDDVRYRAPDEEPRQAWLLPTAQSPMRPGASWWVLRTEGDPMGLAPTVRAAVHELDDRLPIVRMEPLADVAAAAVERERFVLALLAAFAAIGLVLGAVGIYGVMSYTVARRTRELGIRMALGSGRGRTASLVMRQAVVLVAGGLTLGVAASLGATRLMADVLYGVSPWDPAAFAAAAALLACAALLAAWMPVRRALRLDPVEALRLE